MTEPSALSTSVRSGQQPIGFRVWHLCLLTLLVAVAIVNIQDQRRTEPVLIAIAIAGFVLYALLGWAGWRLTRRFHAKVGTISALAIYLTGMAALFLVATIAYLLLEHAYLFGL